MRVFVTGASGFVGTHLISALLRRRDQVVAISRDATRARKKLPASVEVVEGDPSVVGPWMEKLGGCDAVVNLAGESIAGRRWSEDVKRQIRYSRVLTTHNVVEAVLAAPKPPVLVSASAIGIYGFRDDDEIDETSGHGDDFLAQVCEEWEAEALKAEEKTRVAVLRFGVVLGKGGGALEQLVKPFKLFVGGAPGSGRQWFSWIHIDDLVGIILMALDNAQAKGPINATAPHPVTMRELAKELGRVLHRPSSAPVPAFAIKAALGAEAARVVLEGQRVLPRRALALGYPFRFENVSMALRELLG